MEGGIGGQIGGFTRDIHGHVVSSVHTIIKDRLAKDKRVNKGERDWGVTLTEPPNA